MAILQNSIIPTSAAAASYTVENSLKFDGSTSYLDWGNSDTSTTWTMAFWFKRGKLTNAHEYMVSWGTNRAIALLGTDDRLYAHDGTRPYYLEDERVLRDPAAWMHFCLKVSAGTETPYLNGEALAFGTNSGYSFTPSTASGDIRIGSNLSDAYFYSGYISDFYYISGTALAPDGNFIETDDNGQWVPKAYSGSYGTNGFHLDFSDSADLGADAAGSNDFTATNLGSHDQMGDTPNNNFATMNPIGDIVESGSNTFSEGNLTVDSSYAYNKIPSTIGVSSGKWYAEARFNSAGYQMAGVGRQDSFVDNNKYLGGSDGGISHTVSRTNGYVYTNGSGVAAVGSFSAGDVINIALDLDSGTKKVWFGKNGTWDGTPGSSGGTTVTSGTWFFAQSYRNSCTWNFGQDSTFNNTETEATNADGNDIGEFHNTVPSGFLALCTANLPDPGVNNAVDDEKSFGATTYVGNSSSTHEIDTGFEPSFIWIKNRGLPLSHYIFDSLRPLDPTYSVRRPLHSNVNYAEYTTSIDYISSFDSDGFTIGVNDSGLNYNNYEFVAWTWKAGSTATNEAFNASAGFSIVMYTGTWDAGMFSGDNPQSVSHSLGVAPELMLIKDRDNTGSWVVYHKDLDTGSGEYLVLDTNAAVETSYSDDPFGTESPTNSVFKVASDSSGAGTVDINTDSTNYIAYLFASVEGYSKVGSYTGNADTDGTFIYLGFKPACVLVKNTGSGSSWMIWDSSREGYNPSNKELYPDDTSADGTAYVDLLSNGFKLRHASTNANTAHTIIYYAVADNPFKYANAR